jgi:glutathione synthase/RimK-type ligase-like ATP-grasp enzyme
MTKFLIIINEPFEKMAVGKNSNLAYILSCLELGFDGFIYVLPQKNFFPEKISAISLKALDRQTQLLIKSYKEINSKLKKDVKVEEIIKNLTYERISLSDLDLVLQRLEPMKSPFPPNGKEDFSKILEKIEKAFPNKIINLPINLSDKGAAQQINAILAKRRKKIIAIPTHQFKISDVNFVEILVKAFADYEELFPENKERKIVIKPQNSAQSYGVFSIVESKSGMDLDQIQKLNISELFLSQSYQIKENLNSRELAEIIEILLCTQRIKINYELSESYKNKKFKDISRSEIKKTLLQLYNGKILSQPFLEGIKAGDIRSLFAKNSKGDFYLIDHVFRKNIRKTSDHNFTTSYSSGHAKATSIDELTEKERKDLKEKCKKLLEVLNGDFRKKYEKVVEIGCDFILVGDYENVLLTEINHTCPALLPIAESLSKKEINYDGGLFYTKKVIADILKRQG